MDIKILKNIKSPVFYVTNDVTRAIGLEKILPNYHIICLDDHPLVDCLQKAGVSVFCLERQLGQKNILFRASSVILNHPLVLAFIKKIKEKSAGQQPNILFFKPQKRLEILAKKYGFNLIGNPVETNRIFEDKLSFFKICRREEIGVPPGEIINLSLVKYRVMARKYGEVLVCQFGRGWAGNSTYFVDSEKGLGLLQSAFGQMPIKISKFIKGITVLNNMVIFDSETLVGPPAIQIKAQQGLTSTQAGTQGRQWPANLDKDQEEKIKEISLRVANLMRKKDYQGFLGLDFLIEQGSGQVFLSENNARLTASVPFYTKLELEKGSFPLLGFHLLSFLPGFGGSALKFEPGTVSGAEVVARNPEKFPVRVLGEILPGIYDKNFRLKRQAYFLNRPEKGDFWLTAAADGRVVNPEIEIAKLQAKDAVCNERGELALGFSEILLSVKSKLKLKKC